MFIFFQSFQRAYFIIALVFIAVGTGGIKANVSPFGAQQLEDAGPKAIQSFFNWFYWFVNLGSVLAFSIGAYVQQEVSFAVGYVIPAVAMLLSIVLFLIPRNVYRDITPGGNSFSINPSLATVFLIFFFLWEML